MHLSESIEDQVLMQYCHRGEDSGFAELYKRYSKTIFNTIIRLVNDFSQSEDLLQEVFVSIYQEIKKGNKIEYFGGYAKRIAVNRSISFLRKEKKLGSFEEYQDQILEEDCVDEDAFELKVSEVRKAISVLPDGFRTIVNLYLVEGIPHEEIANMLGITHSTVRSQYHRAKKKILSTLQKEIV